LCGSGGERAILLHSGGLRDDERGGHSGGGERGSLLHGGAADTAAAACATASAATCCTTASRTMGKQSHRGLHRKKPLVSPQCKNRGFLLPRSTSRRRFSRKKPFHLFFPSFFSLTRLVSFLLASKIINKIKNYH
jgi:hypothetical protein